MVVMESTLKKMMSTTIMLKWRMSIRRGLSKTS